MAATGWGVLLIPITEALSLFHAVTRPGVVGAWLGAGVAGCLFAVRGKAASHQKPPLRPGRLERTPEKWLLAPVAGIVAALGTLGAATPPNNYDSMTYHMSRVAHWVQNGSVAHYPTHILRQIYQTPWAEFALLQMQVTCGGDRCANLVQWAAMVGSVAGVSWIARQLGAGPRGQVFAAVLCATIPMGLLQATSTQNDYVLAFWLVCLVTFVLAVVSDTGGASDRKSAVAAGAALGLALLTKGTGYLLACPFVLWLGVVRNDEEEIVVAVAIRIAAGCGSEQVDPLGFVGGNEPFNSLAKPGISFQDRIGHRHSYAGQANIPAGVRQP